MEFNEKLQQLRKQKGLTQEQLADALFVSRAAISKWESGRGYPSIDSLKAIGTFFSITIDELLSSHELLTAAEEDNREKENHFCDLFFGLLDLCSIILLFLPFFAQRTDDLLREVSLIMLTGIAPYLKVSYWFVIIGNIVLGLLALTLQNTHCAFWLRNKHKISLGFSCLGILLFIISLQPYPAILLLVFTAMKGILMIRKQ